MELIGNFPTTFRFTIPEGANVKNASVNAPNVKVETSIESDGKVLAVKLASEVTKNVELTIRY